MSGIKCSSCGSITDVVDSRPMRHSTVIKRTRKCQSCGDRQVTYEVPKLLYQRLEISGAGDNSDKDQFLISMQKMHDQLGELIKKRKAVA